MQRLQLPALMQHSQPRMPVFQQLLQDPALMQQRRPLHQRLALLQHLCRRPMQRLQLQMLATL
jgi:hypothetical protein